MGIFYFVIGLLFQLVFYGNEALNVMALAHIILWPLFVIFWVGFYGIIVGVAILFYMWFTNLFQKPHTRVVIFK